MRFAIYKNRIFWFFAFYLTISLLAISLSFYSELILGNPACYLCLVQRWVYSFVGAISVFGLFSTKPKVFVYLLLLAFLAEFFVSFYHALIQLGFISDPCSVPKVSNQDEFWKLINTHSTCAKSSWNIFGIPITIYNSIFSGTLFISIFSKRTIN